MPSLAKSLRIRRSAYASLRRSTGVDFHQHATSFRRFVRELLGERRPSGVIHGLGQHSTSQAFYVQLFNHNQPEHCNQRPGHLMREIRSLIAYVSVSALQLSNGFLSVITAPPATGDLALRPAQRGLGLFVTSRIFDLGSVRERGKGCQSNVKASLVSRRLQGLGLAFNAEDGVPLSGLALDHYGFDIAFDWPMQLQLNLSHALNMQFPVFQQSASIAVTGEGNAVVSAGSPKAGITSFLTSLDASEESFESLINTAQYILTAREVSERQIAVGANLFQLIGLIVVVDRSVTNAVRFTALLKRGIVETASFNQLAVKRHDLSVTGIKPVFKILLQLSTLLICDVLLDRRLRDVAHRADVITSTPKRRKSGFEPRKFFTQNAGSEAFELRRNVRRSQRRIRLNEDVNVIRHDLKRMYRRAKFSGFFFQQFFQSLSHVAAENRLAVFWTPNQVVFEREDRASIPSISSVNHRKQVNISLDILQLTNVEFEEGIVLREALRTMRNSPASYKQAVPFRETYG